MNIVSNHWKDQLRYLKKLMRMRATSYGTTFAICALCYGGCKEQPSVESQWNGHSVATSPEAPLSKLISDSAAQAWLAKIRGKNVETPHPVSGRSWVVASAGSDEQEGTDIQPLATIQKALQMARPGDQVLVRKGIYSERIVFPRSGEKGRPIILKGERGSNGEWLTYIDLGEPMKGWQPASEIGPGVFKLSTQDKDPYCLTADGKQVLRIHDRLMGLPWDKAKTYVNSQPIRFGRSLYHDGVSGFSLLTLPVDAVVGDDKESVGLIPFWNSIKALYGVKDGTIYLRLKNGENPESLHIRASENAAAITLSNRSHIIVRDLAIRGADKGIVLTGGKSNVIEENSLHHGQERISLSRGASDNQIRNNEISLGYFGSDDFGAWGGTHGGDDASPRSQGRMLIYRAFKHIMGTDSSADLGIKIFGAGPANRIVGNHIFSGLKAISGMETKDIVISGNVIHNMSSVGIVTLPGLENAHIHDNLLFDCNIIVRIHHYNTPSRRSEYLYRNILRQPESEGTHLYVHYNDFGKEFPADQEPRIGIYQNTFLGGNRGLVCGSNRRGVSMSRTVVLNNIISTRNEPVAYMNAQGIPLYAAFDYNWVGGRRTGDQLPAWFGPHNINAIDQQLWAADYTGELAPPVIVQDKGIDLSHPFVIAGKQFESLPGMKPGYFTGPRPALGAIQSSATTGASD